MGIIFKFAHLQIFKLITTVYTKKSVRHNAETFLEKQFQAAC